MDLDSFGQFESAFSPRLAYKWMRRKRPENFKTQSASC